MTDVALLDLETQHRGRGSEFDAGTSEVLSAVAFDPLAEIAEHHGAAFEGAIAER